MNSIMTTPIQTLKQVCHSTAARLDTHSNCLQSKDNVTDPYTPSLSELAAQICMSMGPGRIEPVILSADIRASKAAQQPVES